MNVYVLFPSIAFFVNMFVWIYVFAQQKRDPVNATFLMFAACNIGWIGCDLLMYIPAIENYEPIVSRVCSFFWIPCGFWFLLFAYALIGKRRDWAIALAGAAAAIGIAVTVLTNAVVLHHKHIHGSVVQIFHPIYQPMIAVITAVTSAYAVLLILRKRSKSTDTLERRALGLLIWGAIVVMGFIAVNNVLLPSLFDAHAFITLGSSAFTVFVVLVFLAVTRYRFLSISVEKVAEELFEDLHEGVLLADRTGRVQRSNLSARKIFGESIEGKDIRDLFFGCDTEGDFTDLIISPKLGTSAEKHYSLSSSTIRKSDEVLGKIYMVRDVTEQKQAEAVLRRSKEELEREVKERTRQLKHAQRMEAVGTLAGGIAHDFNNVLAVILGFANTARQDTPKNSPVHSDIEEIIVAGNRGREIVRQILTISRKQDTSDFVPADLNAIIQETVDLVKVSLPANISMKTGVQKKPIGIRCDTTQIAQVIMNLCNNAVYAMKKNEAGELEVGVEGVIVDEKLAESSSGLKPGSFARLFVKDTGCGIDEKNISQIFNPFYTTKPQGEGTGLGLATAYVIIQNHDGDILVESEVGKGTTFSIYLPILTEDVSFVKALICRDSDPPEPFAEHGELILFIDDEPQVRRMGHRVLEQLGYGVIAVDSAEEALKTLQGNPSGYDLIITDYNMPGMNGIELASSLFASGNTIPVILMSGYGDKITREEIDAAGVNAFLQKPTHKKLLSATIRKIFDKRPSEF